MYKGIIFIVLFITCVDNQSTSYVSPCPQIFTYDTRSPEVGKWYGTINVRSDVTLYGLWIDVILDRPAESIGNSLGDVSTSNNIEFKIENKNQVLNKGISMSIRILVSYDTLGTRPNVKYLRMNGRQICAATTESSNEYMPSILTESRVTNQYSTPNRNNRNGNTNHAALPLGTNESSNNKPIYNRDQRLNNEINGSVESSNTNRGQSFNYNIETSTRRSSSRDTIGNNDKNPYSNSHNINQQSRGTQYDPPNNYGGSSNNGYENRDELTGDTYLNNGGSRVNNNGRSSNRGQPDNTYNSQRRQTSTVKPSRTTNNRNNGYDSEDYDYADSSSRKKDQSHDYFEGDFRIPADSKIDPTPLPKTDAASRACGKVAIQAAPLVVGGQTTIHGQWPWHVALYQTQTVDSKYICGGSLITTTHVITAAHCVTRKNSSRLVNAQTLTVYLGKYNLRKSSDSVQIMLVRKIFVHPDYNATNFYSDVSVLKLNKPTDYTIYVRPVCLWKESESALTYVVEREGTVVGWGFDEEGHVTEDLTLVKMPIVKQSTCLWSFSEFYSHFTSEKSYCAGFENGTSVCNGDSGGGMVFPDNTERDSTPTWRLRGLVSISVAKQNEYRCDPYHYVVFTDLAQFLDWIKEKLIE